MNKRILSLLLVAAMAFSWIPSLVFAGETGADLTISSPDDLAAFADSVNGGNTYAGKTVCLDANLDLGGEKCPFTPIGASGTPFKGTFDGGFHVISGLYVNGGANAGLFGYVQNGTVKNVTVQGAVTGTGGATGSAAGVVGYLNAGQVIDCGSAVTVKAASNAAGIAGYVNGAASVSGCYNAGDITGTIGNIGGVTGCHWRAGEVTDCYNVGTVTGPATVGGISGAHKAASPVLKNCYNAGKVVDSTGSGNNIGAVIGGSRGTNQNCYFLNGSGPDNGKAGVTGTDALSAADLGSAFTDGDTLPKLAWEDAVSTAKPVRPAFTEATELSAQLAEYIKAAVRSAKAKAGVDGTLLGDADYMAGASSTATDWMAMAMGRFGYFDAADGSYIRLIDDGTGYADYLAAMQAYIEKTYADNGGILHSAKATEWHRAVVAIRALGGDPTAFGSYQGAPIDLIADGSYSSPLKGGPGKQGINGWIWGLIAMDTGMYAVPADAAYPRETFIKEILKMQLTDGVYGSEYGGWVLGGYGKSSDVDITAMAIQALAPYYTDDTIYTYTNEISGKTVSKTVRRCVDEALDVLGSKLNANAGFTSWNTNNAESIAQVVVALCAVGINPTEDTRFITDDGKTLLDGMLAFRLDNGGFCHVANGGWNSMANDQATYALVACWRLENGMRSLYDMRDNRTEEQSAAIKAAADAIDALPDPSADGYKASLKSALAAFRAVDKTERRYVGGYAALAAAIDLVGGEAALDTDEPYITAIAVTKQPNKTKYYVGDTFDRTGMVVTAKYSDGSTAAVTDYRVYPTDGLSLNTDTVYIRYGILKTSVAVEVREKMPWDGEGTAEDPFLIRTPDDIVELYRCIAEKNMNTAGVHFALTQDLNLKNIAHWRGIADTSGQGFCGHFDGRGHAIWSMNDDTYNANGFFGKLGDGALVENLTIASSKIGSSTGQSIGGIAGIIAEKSAVTIRNCRSYASVTGCFGIGGIVGIVENGASLTVERCTNYGTVLSAYTGGGIVGQVGENRWKNNGAKADIQNCYNRGTIGGAGAWGLGGIVGSYRLGGTDKQNTIVNCYNAGKVAELAASGAVYGSICETGLTLENVYFLDTVNTRAGGVFTDDGSDTAGTVTGSAAAKSDSSMKADDFAAALGAAFANDTDGKNDGYPVLTGQHAPGEEAPVRAGLEIKTADELKAFADRVNGGESFTNKTVMLTAHIDLSGIEDWTPIGTERSQFNGVFDGQGYVIDNLSSTKGGLFGYARQNAVIRNVGVASGEINVKNRSFVGGILGYSNGADIQNCYNGADVSSGGYGGYCGGIVGTVRDGGSSTISGCFNSGSISGHSDIGGIVGHLATDSNGTSVHVLLTDCYNLGTVTAFESNAGGIVGRVQDGHVLRSCYNAGTVTENAGGSARDGGGILGLITDDNTVESCFFDAAVTANGINQNSGFTVTPKTAGEMTSPTFAALLGERFKADRCALVNGGYPLLDWQKTEDADAIDHVNELIAAIGTVTLESADAVSAARSAYDALDDSLKPYVADYAALTETEAALAALQALAQTKAAAVTALRGYKSLDDYRSAQQEELTAIIADGEAAIQAAETAEDAAKALALAKQRMDAVKTDRQLTEEEEAKDPSSDSPSDESSDPASGGTSAPSDSTDTSVTPPDTGADTSAALYALLPACTALAALLLLRKKKTLQ